MPGRSPVALAQACIHLRLLRRAPLVLAAAVAVAAMSLTAPAPVEAAGPKVVIVVGPSHGATARYLQRARIIASVARGYGARVVEVYTPYATWARVRKAAQGAKVLVYLGHGYGSPSPYGPLNKDRMNGFGLNPVAGRGKTSPVRYYGESQLAGGFRLAKGSVVILHHLCYASGNGEMGMAEPGWAVARKRVDNFAAGFLRAGASAVLADAHGNLSYELRVVLKERGNLVSAWRRDPDANGHVRVFRSLRRPGYVSYMDPDGRSTGFYRSLVTTRTYSTKAIWATRPPAKPTGSKLAAATTVTVNLRSRPASTASSRGTIHANARLTIVGTLRTDEDGRTWAPVRTGTGRVGWVAAWLLRFGGPAVVATDVNLRTGGSTTTRSLGVVDRGTRVAVLGAWADAEQRVWFKVRTGTGRIGWMAAWKMEAWRP